MPGTSNLGVSALFISTMLGILNNERHAQLTVFGFGDSRKECSYEYENEHYIFQTMVADLSKNIFSSKNLLNMRFCGILGGLGNPAVNTIKSANVVFDISGGDSFTDLYGNKRFRYITLPKLITLQQGTPLILLPQTYGPFDNPRNLKLAKYIVQNASAAWARDERSFTNLKNLLGERFDPARHHSGVDVAFLLPQQEPEQSKLEPEVQKWLSNSRNTPTIGINISGLIYNDPGSAFSRYKFKANYRKVIKNLLVRFLQETEVNILLVPHVLATSGKVESDPKANQAVYNELNELYSKRIRVIPPDFDQSEMKWLISRCDWFCGTRMHSTIAGLSTEVPTAAIAYSLKTQGVFESCSQGKQVIDPRILVTEDVVRELFHSFSQHSALKQQLKVAIPVVKKRAKDQMSNILSFASSYCMN